MDGGSDEDEEAPCTSLRARAGTPAEEDSQESPTAPADRRVGGSTGAAAGGELKPKSIRRAKSWSDEVEDLYRFQQAGYRDEVEYKQLRKVAEVDRWPETGFVKKLQRKDNTFYYYDRERECEDKEVRKVKVFSY